jgi:cobalt-zinc-cadmium efflux system membrane fusion protein
MSDPSFTRRALRPQVAVLVLVVVVGVAAATLLEMSRASHGNTPPELAGASDAMVGDGRFHPTAPQWAMLTVEPVEQRRFRTEVRTEGKITVDEDRVTRIFSSYAGRVTKILASPGDRVETGHPLFVIEAADSVQAQNDFIAAVAASNKARAQVNLNQMVEQRLASLYKNKAMALKDWQEAQANLTAAQNDLRSAEVALQAVRNRLHLLGKSDAEIDTFEKTGAITPDALVRAPLSGTILQRKIGPGQFLDVGANAGEPAFAMGDLSKVWLVAYVRESDATKVALGQGIEFSVLAYPDRTLTAKVDYVAASIDPTSRRLTVRANVDNSDGLLKPEMFASVTLVVDENGPMTAVPREAIVYEGNLARVWVARDDRGIELRQVALGLVGGGRVQVVDGLAPGEKIVTHGSLFIDRIASSRRS